jgi:hypothetical protein
MASPFTVVKGDEFTRLTPAGIIRCLQVQDPLPGVGLESTHEERGGDVAPFDRPCDPREIIPSLAQSGQVSAANQPCTEPGIDHGIGFELVTNGVSL